MKAKLLLISVVAACVAGLVQFYIWNLSETPSLITIDSIEETSDSTKDKNVSQFSNFPIGTPQLIELNLDERTKSRLTEREWRDQIRDWLLITVLSDSGLSAYDIGNSVFDLPPLRYGYLKASGQFEYGESRSVYIGNQQVLALVPADVTQKARDDAIADIIDRHRKDQAGEITLVKLFEYRFSADATSAEITQLTSINVASYLQPEKSYYEVTIKSLDDLQHFLQQIDDLTYAKTTNEGLILGGRKLQSYQFRGIGLQEVAAIWQSEQDIARKELEFQRFIETEEIAFRDRWKDRFYNKYDYFEKNRLETEAENDREQIKIKIQQQAKKLNMVDGSGFSLDPTFDYEGLRTFLSEIFSSNTKLTKFLKTQFKQAAQNSSADKKNLDLIIAYITKLENSGNTALFEYLISKFNPALQALSEKEIVPLLEAIEELENSGNGLDFFIADILKNKSDSFRFQAARYDGMLKGTEAGMVLFYTDLLAKIWAINYLDSAPVKQINDFVDHTRVRLPSLFDSERNELSSARLWFGHTDRGFQVAENKLFFQRISTRVYSKGHNPLNPSNEVQTSAFLAAPIDWWDDHYEEIARYEPEYFRLNEIMKWSLLIGFITEKGQDNKLRFLDSVKVDHSKWFINWARNNKSLKFDLWSKIKFYEVGYKGTATEAMESLRGKVTAGGVSLAPKTLFRNRVPIDTSISKIYRRSNINYSTKLGVGEFRTFDEISYKVQSIGPMKASVQSTPKPDLRLRSIDSDVVNMPVERQITQTINGMNVEASAGGIGIGDFSIRKTANGFKAAWEARDLDAGQTLVLRASRSFEPEVAFSRDPLVEQLVKLPDPNTYAVKLHDSDKWMVVAKGGGGDSTVEGGWHSRVADPDGGESYQLMFVDKKTIEKKLQGTQWIEYNNIKNGRLAIAEINNRGPPTQNTANVRLLIEGKTVTATVDEVTGAVFIPTKDLSNVTSKRSLEVLNRFDSTQLEKIRNSANVSDEPILVSTSHSPELQDALKKSNVQRVANQIIENPVKAKTALDEVITSDFSLAIKLYEEGKIQNALSELDKMLHKYGPQSDILYLKNIFESPPGKSHHIANVLGKDPTNRPGNPNLLNEITVKLSNIGPRSFEYHIHHGLKGAKSLSKEEAVDAFRSGGIFYRQDDPGLNSHDWNISSEKAFLQTIELDRGRVKMLSDSGIEDLNPAKIIVHTELKNKDKINQIEFIPVSTVKRNRIVKIRIEGQPDDNECISDQNNDNLDCKTQNQTYLILANNQ